MKYTKNELLRILIVDDDEDDRELFIKKLNELQLPHTVSAVADGNAMLDSLEQDKLPHVICMDINLPLPDGFDCIALLKADKRYAHIPVLMYSGSTWQKDIDKAYAAGAHLYIVKPHSLLNITQTLRRAFAPDWRKPQPIAPRESFVIDISYSE
jgi:CheY-like chemotaxis protein